SRLCDERGEVGQRGLPRVFWRRRYGWRGATEPRPGPGIRSPRELRPVHSRPIGEAHSDRAGHGGRRPVFLAGVQTGGGPGGGPVRQRPHRRRRAQLWFGSGKTLLIGTFPGGGYYRNHAAGTRDFFAGLLAWGGIRQQVQSSDAAVKARLHTGAGGTYVWVVNPT